MIVTVVGARPQFIKASVVSAALAEAGLPETMVHTGQHFDANMSDVFFSELRIPPPAVNLGIGGGTHGQNTGRMLEAIEQTLLNMRPSCVMVYGDTDSTLAGALAAAKLHIPVAHVEAGLRSFNRRMPEELNRVLTDHVSTLLFAPSEAAVVNLAAEGIRGDQVLLVGDVMLDVAIRFGVIADKQSTILTAVGLRPKSFILATIHRAENTETEEALASLLDALGYIDMPVVLPLHPRTRKRIADLSLSLPANVRQIAPVGYLDMVMLEKSAALILTDSGGVQKEAFFHRVPCITLRRETEWVELVDAGWNRLIDVTADDLPAAVREMLVARPKDVKPYGSGNAAVSVAAALSPMVRHAG